MQCDEANLIEFRDKELSAAQSEAVQAHLAACTACRNELASIDATLSLLGRFWSSSAANCPPPERIVEYHEGVLGAPSAETVGQHLGECQDCRELVDLLNQMGEGPAFEELATASQPLPPRVRVALAEARRKSLASRLKKTFETVVAEGGAQLKKTPGVVSQMVDELMAPREPDATPNLAAPKSAGDVEPEGETGRRGDREKRGQGDKEKKG